MSTPFCELDLDGRLNTLDFEALNMLDPVHGVQVLCSMNMPNAQCGLL